MRHATTGAWPSDTEELRRFTVSLARRLGRGQVDPEDLAHEVLERWLRNRHPAAVSCPRAWITVVTRRLLVDRARRRRSAGEVEYDCAAIPTAEPDAVPWWEQLEVGAVRHELGRLPPALRETFELFSFESRSYQQIAYQLNIATGTVGTRISRARALLKRRLTERAASAASTNRWAGAAPRVRIAAGGPRSAAARELASR